MTLGTTLTLWWCVQSLWAVKLLLAVSCGGWWPLVYFPHRCTWTPFCKFLPRSVRQHKQTMTNHQAQLIVAQARSQDSALFLTWGTINPWAPSLWWNISWCEAVLNTKRYPRTNLWLLAWNPSLPLLATHPVMLYFTFLGWSSHQFLLVALEYKPSSTAEQHQWLCSGSVSEPD